LIVSDLTDPGKQNPKLAVGTLRSGHIYIAESSKCGDAGLPRYSTVRIQGYYPEEGS
jgi:hypothetical protein